MRIIIDAMGGDNAPEEICKGTAAAAKNTDVSFTLVGRKNEISRCLAACGADTGRFEIANAEDVITMDDEPISVIGKKKNSSMAVALKMLAEGKGDALVSAGNTGALFSGATFIVKREEGIKRAAIGTVMPGKKPFLLLDAGANITVTAEYLEQFAEIGSSYMRDMYGIERPAVGILSNGTEDCKGTPLQLEAGKRLRENTSVNFVGNVEATGVMSGGCDVVVCDGFTGNIFLKASEGVGRLMLSALRDTFSENLTSKLAYMLVHRGLRKIKKRFNPSEYGGSPILGISKPVIKAHGSSDAAAFENAIFQAIRCAKMQMTSQS